MSTVLHKRAQAGAHLPLPGFEPVDGEPLMSVTRGQCDVRPMVTFPATRNHRPLAGTKLYTAFWQFVAVQCSSNMLVSINAVALH